MASTAADNSFAGSGLLRPIPLIAIAILIVNDHWLKYSCPGWLTGKLSDIAGLAFFPLFLQSLWELLQTVSRKQWAPSRVVLLASVGATAVVFSLVKSWPLATEVFRWGLGALQWPARAIAARSLVGVAPVDAKTDLSDLLALPALLLALFAGRSRANRPTLTPGG